MHSSALKKISEPEFKPGYTRLTPSLYQTRLCCTFLSLTWFSTHSFILMSFIHSHMYFTQLDEHWRVSSIICRCRSTFGLLTGWRGWLLRHTFMVTWSTRTCGTLYRRQASEKAHGRRRIVIGLFKGRYTLKGYRVWKHSVQAGRNAEASISSLKWSSMTVGVYSFAYTVTFILVENPDFPLGSTPSLMLRWYCGLGARNGL